MKIFGNKTYIYSSESSCKNNSPNFRAKEIITTVTNPNSWKLASLATSSVAIAFLELAKNKDNDLSDLEKFLSEQKTKYFLLDKEVPAYKPEEIEMILGMFKENPELITQMILMKAKNQYGEMPRFSATKLKMIINVSKENPELVQKLINMGEETEEEVNYTFDADKIVKIVELSNILPEFIDQATDVTIKNFDGNFIPKYTNVFEYEYLVDAHKNNPIITDKLLGIPNLRAHIIKEATETFKTADFFIELQNSFADDLKTDFKTIEKLVETVKLIQTPVKKLSIGQKQYLLETFTKNFPKERVEIFRKYLPDFDSKINQLKIALGLHKENIPIAPKQRLFVENFIANNSQVDNVFKNFNFAQYKKQGLPLKYSRKDFVAKIEEHIKDLNQNEQNIVLQNFGLIQGHDGFDGLLVNRPFKNKEVSQKAQDIAQKISEEIELFTTENKVITGDKNADKILTGLIQGLPEFTSIIGKEQHGKHAYSLDIHTLKVLQSAMNNPIYKELTDKSKTILKFSILLHDLGKKGMIKDEGHASASTAYASMILEKFPFKEEFKNRVTDIIENHHWFENYNKGLTKPHQIAGLCRHFEDIFIYSIFAKSDFENVNSNFHIENSEGVNNQEDFDKFMEEKMNPIYESFFKMRSQSNFVFDTKLLNNGENFPRKNVVIDGKTETIKVLDFNHLETDENLQKYGFAPNTTKENARFIVHMTKKLQDTILLTKNSSNKVAWSTSLVKYGANNTVEDFGFIFNTDQANISLGYNSNLSLGHRRSIDDFMKVLFLEENDEIGLLEGKYGDKRTFLKESLKIELAQKGYKLSNYDYIKLAEYLISKDYTSQMKNDLVIGKHKIKSKDLTDALQSSLEVLFNKEGHNEIECINPVIKGLFARVDSIDKCPQEFLRIAVEFDLPIILMPPSGKN